MKLKVCGMKYNPLEVAALQPDYLGFIFWQGSSRFFEGAMPPVQPGIQKVGVFVDAPMNDVLKAMDTYDLDALQLHGKETPDYCEALRSTTRSVGNVRSIIKVFSIKDQFNFKELTAYEDVCDYFLFDTKGKLPGGNGYTFDWKVLEEYPSTKPYFLSGGIGLDNVGDIKAFLQRKEARYCHAIDVNSSFETKAGLKDIKKLKKFANKLKELN
ncbi:N-(5'-phosphoribosyl)anthranilate isomerase [Croceitalea dokdonensis DOKDO 023]|uniref:N-(5'-phosphoribosyl)anthranilate isomerase n=1 Tax=Croceitalea dokdonensis DOKDO 023 TaxID=1300341 RepID=A0A0P7AF00_9FLAO|nr:phosphoribosylanthranilate isomerase [Croceitalea dokdonensis]KPM31822.1 N-(5'-phosphoribosyl)anthranilate isomerase [Croceitalea dokdonensis DOKDO 023]